MISRWYRSRLFWFGLMGLVFLVGAIGLPSRKATTATYSTGSKGWYVGRYQGFVRVGYEDFLAPGFSTSRFSYRANQKYKFFVPAFGTGRMGRQISVGIWFIFAVYIVFWLGSMVWWQRRKHRLMNASIP